MRYISIPLMNAGLVITGDYRNDKKIHGAVSIHFAISKIKKTDQSHDRPCLKIILAGARVGFFNFISRTFSSFEGH